MAHQAAETPLLPENVYGSQKRIRWIVRHLRPDDTIVDFGCGTGVMVTLPLARLGYRVLGLDEHEPSLKYGRGRLRAEGLDETILRQGRLSELPARPDVIIASEVLEHLPKPVLSAVMDEMREHLKPGGKLLVTVPNGYGWFELESFLWYRARLGRLLDWAFLTRIIPRLKKVLLRVPPEMHPSTLSPSPHVQRFTLASICALLEAHGFKVRAATGGVLVCGPFSNLAFTGLTPAMRLNAALGARFSRAAAAFYVYATTPASGEDDRGA